MSKHKTIARDAIGKVYDIHDGKDIPLNDNHPTLQCVTTTEFLRRHTIINDKNATGALFIGSDGRFHVISLPQVGMDKHVHGTMGTSPTQYALIKLPNDSLQDIITLIGCDDEEDASPFKAEHIANDDDEIVPFTMTKKHRLVRVPRLMPLPGCHGIDGGSLNDSKVRESIINLHPALGTWVKACDSWLESSGRNENVQLLSAGKHHHFEDLASDGSFMIHCVT